MADESLTSTPWEDPDYAALARPVAVRPAPLRLERSGPSRSRRASSTRWSRVPFALFIVTNAVIFLRPADLLPSMQNLPIYQVVMLLTLLAWAPSMHVTRAMRSPISFCAIMLLPAIFLSHVTHADFLDAKDDTIQFAKTLIYFLMIVGLVTTPARLRTFLKWLTPCILGLTVLGLLQFFHFINFDALAAYQQNLLDNIDPVTGQVAIMERLCSMGIFNDPNDLCMVLCLGFLLTMYWLHDGQMPGPDGKRVRSGWWRTWHLRWVPVALIFLLAVYCTHSRGGFLALLAGVTACIVARFGIRRSIPLVMVAVPVLVVAFAGRATQIDTQETTAQDRMKLWSAGLEMIKEAPLFGIGMNQFVERERLVAHNSFVHCFSELGFFGGTLFMSGFIYSIWALARLRRMPNYRAMFSDEATARFQPYLIGAFTSYTVGYFTLSRAYTEPTYLMWGLAAVYLSLAAAHNREAMPRLSWRMVFWAMCFGVAFIIFMYFFVKFFAHFGG
jgi:O-antigen ligase